MSLRWIWSLLILTWIALPVTSVAEDVKRSVNFEWEEVPDSVGYEVEFTKVLPEGKKGKPIIFKTQKNILSKKIPLGRYDMRIRSIDDRDVVGEWGDTSPIVVRLPNIKDKSPVDQTAVDTNEEKEYAIQLKWSPIDGVSSYTVEIFSETGERIVSETVEKNSFAYDLPVAKSYKWTVVPSNQENPVSETPPEPLRFSLVGKKLNPPDFEAPQTKYVTEIKWSAPDHAEKYNYVISRKEKDKWVVVDKKDEFTGTTLPIDPTIPGGLFRVQVQSGSNLRSPSSVKTIQFPVHAGKRTPDAIEVAVLREAIEYQSPWYFGATYLLSNLDYKGQNKESGSSLSYSVIGGTGRLGLGYFPKGKWGFVGTLDASGVVIQGQNFTYSSLDTQLVWRSYLGEKSTQVRVNGGLAVKELPEAQGQTDSKVKVANVQSLSPVMGLQLLQPVTSQLGVQLNSQFGYSLMKMSTPSGGEIVPSLSYQIGVMGSYKFKRNWMGFAGVAHRVETVKYKAREYAGDGSLNFAKPGDVNSVELIGNFLNLHLEWAY